MIARCFCLALFLTFLTPIEGRAQHFQTWTIEQPVWQPDREPKVISFFLLHTVRPSEQDGAKWLLLDATSGVIVSIAPVKPEDYGRGASASSVLITPLQPLLLDHT